MSATTTEKKKHISLQGKRLVYWNPDRDARSAAPPTGYERVRVYGFTFVDGKKTEAAQIVAQAQAQANPAFNPKAIAPSPAVFKDLILRPGINWVDCTLWSEVKAESTKRFEQENDGPAIGKAQPQDEIQVLLDCRAIIEFQPLPDKTVLQGLFEDYNLSQFTALLEEIATTPDAGDQLKALLPGLNDVSYREIVNESIKRVTYDIY